MGIEHDATDHKDIMDKYQELVDKKRIVFTTFHQSMDYEDFVEGLKPNVMNGNVTYDIKDGIFKKICFDADLPNGINIDDLIDKYLQSIKGYENKKEIPTKSGRSKIYVWWKDGNDTISTRSTISQSNNKADSTSSPLNIEKIKLQAIGEGKENNWKQYADAFISAVKKEYKVVESKEPYVLIIDEINRGNISKIFGELITLLEADKRTGGNHSIKVTLPYSQDEFGVPSNLYIIGTMNTTDRSVGHIDYAVRRRFAFYTLTSNIEAINSYYDTVADVEEGIKNIATNLFDAIQPFVYDHKSSEFDIDDLKIGHSYFMAKTKEELNIKLNYEIIPLLKEYEKDGIIILKDNELKELNEKCRKLLSQN